MEANERNAIVLALIDSMNESGSWTGETHVQKCAYFLQEGLDVDLQLEFMLYKHGPFSFDLRQLLGELRGSLLIGVEPRSYPYGPSLQITDSGKAFEKAYSGAISRHRESIHFVAKTLGTRTVVALERLATALLVSSENPGADANTRASLLTEAKPHIPTELALTAVNEADQLVQQGRRR